MREQAKRIQELLKLRVAPVALSFLDSPPEGVPRIQEAAASSCTYWKRAADGQVFYTEASDHYNCPVGAYTHGIDLPEERKKELEEVVGTMLELSYLRAEEVEGIPRRKEPFRFAAYAPLSEAPEQVDVVLVCGNAKQTMLLSEAAGAAGVSAGSPLMGRPTCAAIPEAVRTNGAVASLGCIGNRVYTELQDDELYFALPGNRLNAVVEKLEAIVRANRELEAYHRARVN